MIGLGAGRASRRPVNTSLHAAGIALAALAAGMAAAGVTEAVSGGDEVAALLGAAAVTGAAGLAGWRGTRLPRRISAASAFTAVTVTWVVATLFGALPFALAGVFDHLDDALFESVAGFTTTSSTLFARPEAASDGLLLWRSLLQWFGGMAAVVLAVAVLPFLGVGGLDVVRAEAPGPEPERLAPWVAQTARRLWWIYAGITAVIVAALLAVGTSLFDGFTYAFGAVSTGGFAPHAASAAALSSRAVEVVLMAGMLAGAVSFTLHWRGTRGDGRVYRRSRQLRTFAGWVVAGAALVTVLSALDDGATVRGLRRGAFAAVSMATTTGFQTVNFSAWVPAAQIVLLLLLLAGAMTGSAAGGLKILRLRLVAAYARRELRRARHPRGVFPFRLGGRTIEDAVVAMAAGFVVLYVLALFLGALALAALGSDLLTALGASASALSNTGPGPGDVGSASAYAALSRPDRAVLDVLMVVGRVEIFPLLLALVAPGRALAQRRGSRRAAAVSRPHAA